MKRPVEIHGDLQGSNLTVAIVVGRFNEFISERLLDGALDCLLRHGVKAEKVTVLRAPGAFEIPQVARKAAECGKFDAVICLGAVIRGATPHFDYVASTAVNGIANVALQSGIPVTFGILTTETVEQAIERAGTKSGNKGWDAALAAIEMVNLMRKMDGE